MIALLGGAVAWPCGARAAAAMPVIGYLNPTPPDMSGDRLAAFRHGLKDTGYIEGENVSIIYRWADNDRIECRSWASRINAPTSFRDRRIYPPSPGGTSSQRRKYYHPD